VERHLAPVHSRLLEAAGEDGQGRALRGLHGRQRLHESVSLPLARDVRERPRGVDQHLAHGAGGEGRAGFEHLRHHGRDDGSGERRPVDVLVVRPHELQGADLLLQPRAQAGVVQGGGVDSQLGLPGQGFAQLGFGERAAEVERARLVEHRGAGQDRGGHERARSAELGFGESVAGDPVLRPVGGERHLVSDVLVHEPARR
jgi:hypothetical protein